MHARDVRLLSAAGLASLLVTLGSLEIRTGLPLCPAARAGRTCDTCGGTRAFRKSVRGDVVSAFRINPLGALAGMATWPLMLGAALSTLFGRLRFAILGVTLAAGFYVAALACEARILWRAVFG